VRVLLSTYGSRGDVEPLNQQLFGAIRTDGAAAATLRVDDVSR
jgi:hypothetical protein